MQQIGLEAQGTRPQERAGTGAAISLRASARLPRCFRSKARASCQSSKALSRIGRPDSSARGPQRVLAEMAQPGRQRGDNHREQLPRAPGRGEHPASGGVFRRPAPLPASGACPGVLHRPQRRGGGVSRRPVPPPASGGVFRRSAPPPAPHWAQAGAPVRARRARPQGGAGAVASGAAWRRGLDPVRPQTARWGCSS